MKLYSNISKFDGSKVEEKNIAQIFLINWTKFKVFTTTFFGKKKKEDKNKFTTTEDQDFFPSM